jgi:predicted acylesterase/phospholipase RssA
VGSPIKVKGLAQVDVDVNRIGISYSGGGPLVVVELGIAQAFVERHIYPSVIAGASAGSLAGAAHALDIYDGRGIQMAADVLGHVTNRTLHLDVQDVVGQLLQQVWRYALQGPDRLVKELTHNLLGLRSLGDDAPIGPLIHQGIHQTFGLSDVTFGMFGKPLPGADADHPTPRLIVATTDLRQRQSFWFTPDTTPGSPIEPALIASAAIPFVFPWVRWPPGVEPPTQLLVDGGVVENQPLSVLAVDERCGQLYACAVGPTGELPEPRNLLENLQQSFGLMTHQATKLEEELLRTRLPEGAMVCHVHPEMSFGPQDFNFTPELVRRVMDEARQKTLAWLDRDHSADCA